MSIVTRIQSMSNHIDQAYDELERLGIDLTGTNKNLQNIGTSLQNSLTIVNSVKGEGSSLSLTPTREGGLSIIPKGACEQDSLPTEYQSVEYIEGTGTQWINVALNEELNNTYEFKGSFSLNEFSGAVNAIFGTEEYGSTYSVTRYGLWTFGNVGGNINNKVVARYGYAYVNGEGPSLAYMINGEYSTSTKYNFVLNSNGLTLNNSFYENTGNNSQTYNNFSIFRMYGSNYYGNAKLYNLTITSNNVKVYDFVPCYRKSDNVIGLFDLVNGVFLTNSGTGTFIKGNDVSLPNPYQEIPVKVVTGDNSVVVQNKNWLPFNNQDFTLKGVRFYVQNGNLIINGTTTGEINTISFKEYFSFTLLPGIYTISRDINMNTPCYLKKSSDNSNLATNNGTFTLTEKTDVFFTFYFAPNFSINNINDKFMLELGSTDSEYVPHQEQSITLHLGTEYLAGIGDYKDEIVGKTGNWKIRRKVGKVDLSTLTYTRRAHSTLGYYFWASITGVKYEGEFQNVKYTSLCDKYICSKRAVDYFTNYHYCFDGSSGQVTQIQFIDDDYDNETDFTNSLSETPLYYILATPTEETITDQTLIADLNNMYQAMGYNGQTNITITSANNNAQMIASVELPIVNDDFAEDWMIIRKDATTAQTVIEDLNKNY